MALSKFAAMQPRVRALRLPRSQGYGSCSLAAWRWQRGDGKRGDVLLVMHESTLVVDVSVIHPATETYVQEAAITDGAAATVRGSHKEAKYSCGQAGGGHAFEPIIVETYGRLGELVFSHLKRRGRIAADSGQVDNHLFMAVTLKMISVGLCRGNAKILARGQQVLAKVTGYDMQSRLMHPRAEHVDVHA